MNNNNNNHHHHHHHHYRYYHYCFLSLSSVEIAVGEKVQDEMIILFFHSLFSLHFAFLICFGKEAEQRIAQV